MKTMVIKIIFIAYLMLFAMLPTVHVQAQLAEVGPLYSVTGLPLWYEDTTGQVLELCLDGDGATGPCIFDPVDPTNPFSVQTGFGAEAFYWYASSDLRGTGNARVILVMGLEAAYMNGAPASGDQIVFARIRIRAGNLPVDGVYTFVHPFGRVSFNVVLDLTQRASREVNYTLDVGIAKLGDFSQALLGPIGPFLRWTAPDYPFIDPVTGKAYLGDHRVRHEVTGSPLNTNYFQLIAPGGTNLDPATGSNVITNTLFNLTGKFATRYGVDVKRTVYSRDATGNGFIDVFATSQPAQQVQITGVGPVPTTMVEQPGLGRYFARIPFTSPFPASITASNITDKPPILFTPNVTDAVNITQAVYDTATKTVTVTATSSDLMVPPTFSAVEYPAPFAGGTIAVTPVLAPLMDITINSSAGGSDTESIISAGPQVP